MFDVQTEAYLRRTYADDGQNAPAPIIPAAIAASLILWTGVLLSAL